VAAENCAVRELYVRLCCQALSNTSRPLRTSAPDMCIRPYETADLPAVLRLSLRAWAPVFAVLERDMDPEVYQYFYPDWRKCQQNAVEEVCADPNQHVWVAVDEGQIAGFTAVTLRTPTIGEIYMLAVDPEFQRRGHASADEVRHGLDARAGRHRRHGGNWRG
jgi:ribosomal protein S18 acetylase RimI-like enzyme